MNKKVSKNEVIEKCWELYNEYGYLTTRLQRGKSGYSQVVVDNLFGSFNNLLNEMGLMANYIRISDDDLKREIRDIYKEFGFINKDIIEKNCSISYEGCIYRFDGIENLLTFVGVNVNDYFQDKVSNNVKMIAHLAEEILKEIPLFEKTWNWLKNPKTNKNMFIDLYFEESNIAIEYDGEQHFKPIEYFGGEDAFLLQKERDREKDRLLNVHGVNLIRFNYMDTITKELIKQKFN